MRALLLASAALAHLAAADLDDAALEQVYADGLPADRGHVRVNFITSLDGAVEIGGRSEALGGPADMRVFATLRGLADAVLVGAGTARTENYGPVRVRADRVERRTARGQRPSPLVAVVSARADLDPAARLFTERADDPARARPLVVTVAAAPPDRVAALRQVADVLICGDTEVDPAAALRALADRGAPRVLCEGGPRLATRLAADGLVDEWCITSSPLLAGPGRATLSAGPPWERPQRLRPVHLLTADGLLFGRWAGADAG
ncbi:MAG TPA: dihydrofolate reductase family protein [Frankiaceae bacterium]